MHFKLVIFGDNFSVTDIKQDEYVETCFISYCSSEIFEIKVEVLVLNVFSTVIKIKKNIIFIILLQITLLNGI